jgi:hypothetical protein
MSAGVALFGTIPTRSVSEGRSYVACDVFPRASLAHASGWDVRPSLTRRVMKNPDNSLAASNPNSQKRNLKTHASSYELWRNSLDLCNWDRMIRCIAEIEGFPYPRG